MGLRFLMCKMSDQSGVLSLQFSIVISETGVPIVRCPATRGSSRWALCQHRQWMSGPCPSTHLLTPSHPSPFLETPSSRHCCVLPASYPLFLAAPKIPLLTSLPLPLAHHSLSALESLFYRWSWRTWLANCWLSSQHHDLTDPSTSQFSYPICYFLYLPLSIFKTTSGQACDFRRWRRTARLRWPPVALPSGPCGPPQLETGSPGSPKYRCPLHGLWKHLCPLTYIPWLITVINLCPLWYRSFFIGLYPHKNI